jgi:hypothetical protein
MRGNDALIADAMKKLNLLDAIDMEETLERNKALGEGEEEAAKAAIHRTI